MEQNRKRLSDILSEGQRNSIFGNWSQVKAAPDFGQLLPPGPYACRILDGRLDTSARKGTPGYVLEFQIIEGDFKDRHVWHTLWFTERALPGTKRDLEKLGITDPENQLQAQLPRWIICNVRVAVEADDKGNDVNRVRSFDVLRVEPPEPEPFAPPPPNGEGGPAQ
jgi:hypothetical protein